MNDLLTFVTSRHKVGQFANFVDVAGEEESYVLAIEILAWLRRQKRFRHEKELELDPNREWTRALPQLLSIDSSLGRVFEISNGRLRFKSDIPFDERSCIRELVESEYRPLLRECKN